MSIVPSIGTETAATEDSALLSPPPTTIVAFGPTSTRTTDNEEEEAPILLRHDSDFSVGTSYNDTSPNDLSAVQGAILLVAECLGTGLLALPGDVHVLGYTWGLAFLIVNLPINLAAGTVLSATASYVEERQKMEDRIFQATLRDQPEQAQQDYQAWNELTAESTTFTIDTRITSTTQHTALHHDTATYDFIGMTNALFRFHHHQPTKYYTRAVQAIYYLNIFLVLGNYILVMSHAVVAASAERLSLFTAGLVASFGMYAVAQLRTMAHLGRTASVVSLLALGMVVVQCLVAVRQQQDQQSSSNGTTGDSYNVRFPDSTPAVTSLTTSSTIHDGISVFGFSLAVLLRKLSAMGSIGFAVGSQKLLLNIRHELSDRKQAPRTLLYGLSAFGTVYVLIIILAGPNPPSFLFDAIPLESWSRRWAGLLLWGHVMVSYAINSQAICASLERLVSPRIPCLADTTPTLRWMTLTGCLAILAYTVANVIPFFDDLVALIGSLTSVPLTLLLPALFWRKMSHYPLWTPTFDSLPSWLLLLYAALFMLTATIGSLWSIRQDWVIHRGTTLSC